VNLLPFLMVITNDFDFPTDSACPSFQDRRGDLHAQIAQSLSAFLGTIEAQSADLMTQIEAVPLPEFIAYRERSQGDVKK
jgi:hypothetical protein